MIVNDSVIKPNESLPSLKESLTFCHLNNYYTI